MNGLNQLEKTQRIERFQLRAWILGSASTGVGTHAPDNVYFLKNLPWYMHAFFILSKLYFRCLQIMNDNLCGFSILIVHR